MDMRLKELAIWLDGQRYVLRCNMNVLAELQEACGGLGSLLESKMAAQLQPPRRRHGQRGGGCRRA